MTRTDHEPRLARLLGVAEQRDGGAARASDVLDMPRDGTGRRRVTE